MKAWDLPGGCFEIWRRGLLEGAVARIFARRSPAVSRARIGPLGAGGKHPSIPPKKNGREYPRPFVTFRVHCHTVRGRWLERRFSIRSTTLWWILNRASRAKIQAARPDGKGRTRGRAAVCIAWPPLAEKKEQMTLGGPAFPKNAGTAPPGMQGAGEALNLMVIRTFHTPFDRWAGTSHRGRCAVNQDRSGVHADPPRTFG